MAVLDRSWYGRVLVERVEGFASEEAWRRAYTEIVDFETTLAAEGMILVKFWMHVSPEEQLRRFEKRRRRPLQGVETHRRGLAQPREAAEYEAAVEEMLRADRAHQPRRGTSSRATTSAGPASTSSTPCAGRWSRRWKAAGSSPTPPLS